MTKCGSLYEIDANVNLMVQLKERLEAPYPAPYITLFRSMTMLCGTKYGNI